MSQSIPNVVSIGQQMCPGKTQIVCALTLGAKPELIYTDNPAVAAVMCVEGNYTE